MYYIEINQNKITGKGHIDSVEDIKLLENQLEITKEQYQTIELPSSFEIKEGKIVNIQHIDQEPEVIEEVEVDEEKVAMAEAIIQLENKIQELEQKLGGN